MEAFKRWEPVAGIQWPCQAADIATGSGDVFLFLRLRFATVADDPGLDLLVALPWDRLVAFSIWEEFAHPWTDQTTIATLPKLGVGTKPDYTFPLLEVMDSILINGLSEVQRTVYGYLRHYGIVTLDHTIDIVLNGEPRAECVPPLGSSH